MTARNLIDLLRDGWRRFCSAERGNVVITFALAFIPIVGLTGAAVDYSRASAIRTAMQAAADSTALAVSKTASTQTSAQLQSAANSYFAATFNKPDARNLAVTATYSTTNGSSVTVGASATVMTDFMGVMGIRQMPIAVTSTTAWGSSRLRVALVLDNTGSMADSGKIGALQTATKSLLAQLKSAVTNTGDVYVSIIPFNVDVNVGSSNYAANWIDWSDWEDDNGHDTSTTTCTTSKSGRSGRSTKKCTTSTTWVPDNHNTWNGCITDRDQNYDQLATPANPADASLPSSAASTLFPADQYGSCPLAMMGLNYNWTAMNSLVDQMSPNGSTNQPIGLAWGWLSLVGGGPLTVPAMDPNYKYNQVIILLSDGLNTADRWYGDGSSVSTQVDQRMYDPATGNGTCKNIKNAGITIYTIQVNTGGDPLSTLLQNCASSSDKFVMLTSASQILSTFTQIGTNLTKLRVAR